MASKSWSEAEGSELTERKTASHSCKIGNLTNMFSVENVDAQQSLCAPDTMLKEDIVDGFTTRKQKGLALRSKSGSRTGMEISSSIVAANMDSSVQNGLLSVRESISALCFEDTEKSLSIRSSSKWPFDSNALSWPINDGLSEPTNVRRIKIAID